jgi:hypothetical protein
MLHVFMMARKGAQTIANGAEQLRMAESISNDQSCESNARPAA